ncbi:MAG: hypothetical protein V4724_41800 [Pseudomonadota bacterium]
MQRDDTRAPGGGRPSLMSTERRADTGSNRILSELDGARDRRAPGSKKGRKVLLWSVAGASMLAVAAGLAAWLFDARQNDALLAQAGRAPLTPAASKAILPMPVVAVPTAPAQAAVSPVPVAPPVLAANLAEKAEAAPPAREPTLHEMLNASASSPASVAKPAVPPAHKKATKIAAVPASAREAAHAQRTRPTTVKLAKRSESIKEKPAKKSKPAPVQDSDVTLLAALMAHSHASRSARQAEMPPPRIKRCRNAGTGSAGDKAETNCKPVPAQGREAAGS